VADEIDVANDEVQKQLDATLRSVNTSIEKNNTGKCMWCEGEVKDQRRWCSSECRDEHTLYANKL
jgi:hypothetical protein|tara:strand:- start:86 stop:280 length:195 start_codon:yes stop_codon:yes gene_type:complete